MLVSVFYYCGLDRDVCTDASVVYCVYLYSCGIHLFGIFGDSLFRQVYLCEYVAECGAVAVCIRAELCSVVCAIGALV